MKKAIATAIMLTGLLGLPLAAETGAEQDMDVIVTASRVEEEATRAASYVTVISAEQLSEAGQATLVEALESLAGVHFRSFSGNAAQAEVSMRGFGENSHGRVLVLLDGRRLNRPDMASINWLEIPIENIERVEVVRGGGSVLYGDNAVAGVINIITKRRTTGFDVAASGQYGSFNQNQERVEVSGSLGAVSLSATAEHSATDGYRDRSAYRSLAFTTGLGLDLERLSTSLALSYTKLFFEMPGWLTQAQMEADPTQANNPADESNNQCLNADLGFSYGPAERLLLEGNLSYGLKFIQSDMVSYFPPSYTDLTLHTLALTPKLQIESQLLSGNRLIAGLDAYYDRMSVEAYPDAGRTTTDSEYLASKATAGIYATDDLSLSELLTLSAGARFELSRMAAESLKTSGTPYDESRLLQSLVYQAGVLLNPAPAAKVWLRYGSVYRYPFLDEIADLYDSGFLDPPFNTALDPERGHDFELGAQARLLGRLELSASAFWLEMEDEIAYDFGASLNVNLDKTRHLGVEAEAAFSPSQWIDLSGSYTYTLAFFREGVNEGKSIPLVPAHRATGEAVFSLPIGLAAGVAGRYVGEQYAGGDYDNSLEMIEAYWLLDLYLRYRPRYLPGELELFLGVENLLDTSYASSGYDYFTYVVYYPGTGRSWKLGASYRY